jgi:uncharacterized protein YbaP (TraB family)
MMMNIRRNSVSVLIISLVLFSPLVSGEVLCRPYQILQDNVSEAVKYGSGLLWKLSYDGSPAGYIFGTIHIDDEAVLNIPEPVLRSLQISDTFVMEVVPDPAEALVMSRSMFFMDGTRLDELVNQDIFNETTQILEDYGFTRDIVTVMKPWAAYIVMSYPKNSGEILDLKLLQLARSNGANVFGLETAMEQVNIFAKLSLDDQARILTDVVCHYDNTRSDFSEITEHYLNRDLDSLYSFSKRYTFNDDSVYEKITEKLIDQRNNKMVERILQHIQSGVTFIAVGALHLPGENGILNQLESMNYQIDRVY